MKSGPKTENKPQIIIESKSLYRTLARVVLPIALQSLIASSLNLVDNLMVGSLGEVELAAVGLSTQLFFVHFGVMFGFASGSAAFMAQFWGKQDVPSIRKVTGFAVLVCFGISMLFFLPAFLAPESVLRLFTDIPEVIGIGRGFRKNSRRQFSDPERYVSAFGSPPHDAANQSSSQSQRGRPVLKHDPELFPDFRKFWSSRPGSQRRRHRNGHRQNP